MLPSLSGLFDIDRASFPSAGRRPHSAAELGHPQHRESGDLPFPVGPSPKRPRLSYDYEFEPKHQGMDPMNKVHSSNLTPFAFSLH